MNKSISFRSIQSLSIVSFLAITLITFFKVALELEDAEQAYYSQWFRLGYDDQPPLYTWLQIVVNSIFGVHKLSFSILRGTLFSAVLMILYLFAKIRKNSIDTAKLAVVLLVLIPVFIDFTFRRLSHTTLLCLSVISTYCIIQKLLDEGKTMNYLLLGLFMGIGMLSKYNYVFFLVSFLIVSFLDTELRKVIWKPKIVLTFFIFFLVTSPHLYWLLSNYNFYEVLQNSISEKMNGTANSSSFSLSPLIIFFKRFLAISILILIVGLLLYSLKKLKFLKIKKSWFSKIFIVQLVVFGLFFLVFQSDKVETRWLLPLFLPFVVLVVELIQVEKLSKHLAIGFYLFYFVIAVQFVRTPIEKLLNISSSVHYGFNALEEKLIKKYANYQWILPDVTFAGNIRLLQTSRKIYALDDYSVVLPNTQSNKWIKVVIEPLKDKYASPTDSLIGFGHEQQKLYFYKGLRD